MPRRAPLLACASLLLAVATSAVGQTAQDRLWDASISGDTLAVRTALSDGAVIDSIDTRTNRNGRLALNWAAWNDRVAVLRILLDAGAPLEAENHTGFTALHHAAESGSVAAARFLLEAGADPAHPNRAGQTPLQTALARGNQDVAALLLEAEEASPPEE